MAFGMTAGEGSIPQPKTSPLRSAYGAAFDTQAQDYDNIMGGYKSLQTNAQNKRTSGNQLGYVPISGAFQHYSPNYSYQRSGELNTALGGLQDYAKTGGYSDADIGNIRERSISPIRSIYSSAQDNLRRRTSLQGGYSPNAGALTAKMARDSSSQIGDITTKVNAQIAEMVARGKLSGLTSLASASANDSNQQNNANNRNEDARRSIDEANTAETNRVNELNRTGQMQTDEINNRNQNQNTQDELNAVQGQQSLYGTTPALTSMFANQVLQNNQQQIQAVQTANTLKNQRANIGLNLAQGQWGKGAA